MALLIGATMVGGVTTLMAELKGASLAVNGIVGGGALVNDGLWGGLGGRLLSTLPINLKKVRS